MVINHLVVAGMIPQVVSPPVPSDVVRGETLGWCKAVGLAFVDQLTFQWIDMERLGKWYNLTDMIETMPTIGSKYAVFVTIFIMGGTSWIYTWQHVCHRMSGGKEIKRKGTQNCILNHQPEESAKEVIGFYLGFLWYTPDPED